MILAEINWPWLIIGIVGLAAILVALTTLCVRVEQKAKKERDETHRRDRKFDDWLKNDIDLHGGNE